MSPYDRLLVVIVNHEDTANALALKQAFNSHVATVLVDSGSALSAAERDHFDIVLPNVYYSGLYNQAAQLALERPECEHLLYVCSDVEISATESLTRRVSEVLGRTDVGVYAPSHTGGGLPFCANFDSDGLRDIPFVDGFCFAADVGVLRSTYPVDLEVNPIGWGIDVRVSYVAAKAGFRVVVDDAQQVYHPPGSGYDRSSAYDQMLTWLGGFDDRSLRYYGFYRFLMKLSRYGLSRLDKGRLSRIERSVFRMIARG